MGGWVGGVQLETVARGNGRSGAAVSWVHDRWCSVLPLVVDPLLLVIVPCRVIPLYCWRLFPLFMFSVLVSRDGVYCTVSPFLSISHSSLSSY